jgi:hypothetical protein
VVAFPWNSNPHILGIPAGDEELHSDLNKDSLPSSSLACGFSSPTFKSPCSLLLIQVLCWVPMYCIIDAYCAHYPLCRKRKSV